MGRDVGIECAIEVGAIGISADRGASVRWFIIDVGPGIGCGLRRRSGVVDVHLELILLKEKAGLLEGQRRANRLTLNHERECAGLWGSPTTPTPPRPWSCLTTSDQARKDRGSSIVTARVHTNLPSTERRDTKAGLCDVRDPHEPRPHAGVSHLRLAPRRHGNSLG